MLPAFPRPKAAWPSGVLAQDAAALSSRAALYPWRRPVAYPARSRSFAVNSLFVLSATTAGAEIPTFAGVAFCDSHGRLSTGPGAVEPATARGSGRFFGAFPVLFLMRCR